MTDLPDFPTRAFAKADPSPDPLFYAAPRFVTHIDDRAIRAVTELYRRMLPVGGRVLDLMSSWISHLPEDVIYAEVMGLGLNEAELAANPRLARHVVQDLNRNPMLPLDDASFDGACCCVSVQYFEQPVAVMREVRRVLKPGAPFIVTFSDRCFPTKAVLIWQSAGIDRAELVALYLARAGFSLVEARHVYIRDRRGDPLWAVVGRAPAAAA
ncbi:class I SAM-dependent methyltransferase [Lichenifustis flavocetrariae]|uniref:Class I SAM-dependent methyltransferase n=1 Tax=Lichenifustis flavocetrariae TaxID=2949735 RepID=A0AA42CMH7_9HYPH|nr:methyltransferase domain-containing protein [Lichenifustis flavocetrariae]MCW6512694.1 class I SAM-dependent methyltransferase [Lichenifustis flavocetrariae]